MGAEQGRRAARVACLIVTMLLTLGACGSQEPMARFCEGAIYAGQANAFAAEAIDASSIGDAATLATKLEAARASLDLADRQLAEASSGEDTDGWQDWFDAFRDALGETRSVLDALAESPPTPASLLRERLESAATTLTAIGPAADCIDFGTQSSD